jgi:hypothetical protein
VSTDSNDQANRFDGQGAKNKGGTRRSRREEHERGNGEKESGWHHDQSGEFHRLSLLPIVGYRELWMSRAIGGYSLSSRGKAGRKTGESHGERNGFSQIRYKSFMNSNALIPTGGARGVGMALDTSAMGGAKQIQCDNSIKTSQLPVRSEAKQRGCFPASYLHHNHFSFQRITQRFPLRDNFAFFGMALCRQGRSAAILGSRGSSPLPTILALEGFLYTAPVNARTARGAPKPQGKQNKQKQPEASRESIHGADI